MADSTTQPGSEVSPISRHLVSLSGAVRLRISEGLQKLGHDLTPSVSQLVPNLPLEGLGMSALAERAGVSLQRAGQLVQQLEDDGYVKRLPDEQDGRARRVVYTRRGRRLVRDIERLVGQLTGEFSELLGAERYRRLVGDLALLDDALNGPAQGIRVLMR